MSLPVECDRDFAAAVDARAAAVKLRGLTGSGSGRDPYLLPVDPLDLLLATGRVTAAIFSPYRELFEASAQWALIRWFWGLWWGSSEVRLSSAAEYIRNHHRTAFSEAMGMGAALITVEHLAGNALPAGLWNGGGAILDVDTWVSSGTRPDFLVLYPGAGAKGDTYVVEAKGNSSGRGRAIEQLQKGIDQVLAMPGPATRLVIGSTMSKAGVGSPHAVLAAGSEIETFAITLREEGSSEAAEPEMLPRVSTVSAREGAARAEAMRLNSFAGKTDAGPLPPPDIHAIPETEVEVVGRRLTLRGETMSAQVTAGVDRRVMDRLGEVGSLNEMSELRSDLAVGVGRTPDHEPVESLFDQGSASKVARDGCAISVRLL